MKNACQTAHSWHEMPSITEETMSYLKMGSVWECFPKVSPYGVCFESHYVVK